MSTSVLRIATLPEITPEIPSPIISLEIATIRRDGGTQSRKTLSADVIREYADQMQVDEVFPPVIVWFDGDSYWLSDGSQRVAAAELFGRTTILAEVRRGTLSDARWSSYGANSRHGMRRTTDDIVAAIRNALGHANSMALSHNRIAKHLNVPEATFRRLLKAMPVEETRSGTCLVTRKGKCYEMNTSLIGVRSGRSAPVETKAKSLKELETRLTRLKERATPPVQLLLNVFANWAFGAVNDDDCLTALARLHKRWTSLQL